MREELLHYIWKHRLFNANRIFTCNGEEVKVIQTGEHNTNAGPDFLNAQVLIDDTLWAGHVEIHVKSSDWNVHRHSEDPAYRNVVLHVVFEHDAEGNIPLDVPVLGLNKYLPEPLFENYEALKQSRFWIPCEPFLKAVDDFKRNAWLERVLVERLEEKTKGIEKILIESKNDWSEVAYRLLAKNFGFKINSIAFEELSRGLPLKILLKHRNSLFKLEALLLGQSGFLDDSAKDEYSFSIQNEYQFLAKKYKLKPMQKSAWKLLRLRPSNFPPIRLSQLASLLFKTEHLFSTLTEYQEYSDLTSYLSVGASAYWDTHYLPGRKAKKIIPHNLGKSSAENILFNTVVPLLFSYGKINDLPSYCEKALRLLDGLPAEKNSIIHKWNEIGLKANSAFGSQALLQLKKSYCDPQRCLDCGIGNEILRGKDMLISTE